MGAPQVASTAAEGAASLQCYVRALCARAPRLHYDGAAPFIAGGAIHLPAQRADADAPTAWRWYRAAVAHAAAHLSFSPPSFDGAGLPPISRALLGLLEDARVEALACRELPGLRSLWAEQHQADAALGDGFEALLLRLARSLIDPGYADPHPWVAKGRRLFYVDAAAQVLALRRPEELRRAATQLGHDIGQMRLPFNAKTYLPGPDYRDDQRWMWPAPPEPVQAEPDAAVPVPRPAPAADAATSLDHAGASPTVATASYPEWDRLIARLRQRWCAVHEGRARLPNEAGAALLPANPATPRNLQAALREARHHPAHHAQAATEGERFDLDAVLRLRLAQRLRVPASAHVFLRPRRGRSHRRTLILVDQSASSAGAWGNAGCSLLEASCHAAWQAALALQSVGDEVAMAGFSSSGRARVAWRLVADFGEALDAAAHARLHALRSADSTRLGAALRHACHRLGEPRDGRARQVLVISDGVPHDIDIHDPRYLREDARHAVRSAQRLGVAVRCLLVDAAGAGMARQMFGAGQVALLQDLRELPRAVRRLTL